MQAMASVTKPIFLIIYLAQTLKPKPWGEIFEEKTPGLRSQRAAILFPPNFWILSLSLLKFIYYLTWKRVLYEKKVKLLKETNKFIDAIISQIVNVSLLS